MPHVIIKGKVAPEDIWLAFAPLEFVEGDSAFKAEEAYLSTDKEVVLIRSLAVERGFKQHFLVKIARKDGDSVSLTLDKLTTPEKSEGVKRTLGLYAWKILQAEPETVIEATNIQEFIREPSE